MGETSTRTAGRRAGNPVGSIPGPRTRPAPREGPRNAGTIDSDNDKFFVECQQDIDIGIESEFPKLEFDLESQQEIKDCVDELRRVLRRVLRRESLGAWLRVQVCLRESSQRSVDSNVYSQVCLHTERECCVRILGNQLRANNRDCERMYVQMVHTQWLLWTSQMQVPTNRCSTHNEQLQGMQPRRNISNCGKR